MPHRWCSKPGLSMKHSGQHRIIAGPARTRPGFACALFGAQRATLATARALQGTNSGLLVWSRAVHRPADFADGQGSRQVDDRQQARTGPGAVGDAGKYPTGRQQPQRGGGGSDAEERCFSTARFAGEPEKTTNCGIFRRQNTPNSQPVSRACGGPWANTRKAPAKVGLWRWSRQRAFEQQP